MPLPLVGSIDARITAVAPVAIHGDRYLDLALLIDTERTAVRIPLHCFPRHPEVDDHIRLSVLLGQVDSVAFLPRGNHE
ncbi:MAG: hypothetical protein SGJ11_03695 [Phycisphaerae bacterium]|nr:hypothetical protein [Phycisphaerae bacterium]